VPKKRKKRAGVDHIEGRDIPKNNTCASGRPARETKKKKPETGAAADAIGSYERKKDPPGKFTRRRQTKHLYPGGPQGGNTLNTCRRGSPFN